MVLSSESLRAQWSRFGGPNAITLPAWLLTIPFAFIPSTAAIEAISTSSNVPAETLTWFLVRVVGQLLLGVVLWVAWRTYLRANGRPSRPILTIITFVLASALRSLIVFLGDEWQGLPTYQLADRNPTVILTSTALLVLATIVVDGYRRHRNVQQGLQNELAREKELSREALTAIDAYRQELLTEVQQIIETELANITADLPRSTDTARSKQLSRLTESVVQPLGRDLMTPGTATLLTPVTHTAPLDNSPKISLWSALRLRPFTPALSALITFVLILSIVGTQAGFVNALIAGASMAAICGVGLELARYGYTPNKWFGHPRIASILIVVIWLLVAAVASGVTTVFITSRLPTELTQSAGLEVPIRAALFLLCWIVGPPVALAISLQWRNAEQQLRITLDSVSHMTAEFNLRAWFERHSLGVRVHGAVQSELVAAALRMVNDPDCDQDELLSDMGERIRIRLSEPSPTDWRASLQDISQVWGFSIDLHMDIAAEASQVLDRDASIASAALEIVREGIINAVRAGAANRVDVNLSLQDFDLIILVRDDGDGLMNQNPPGAGTSLLDQTCLTWAREDNGAGTVLHAVLATKQGVN